MFSNMQQLPAAIATLTAASELTYISTPGDPQPPPPAPQGICIRGYLNVTGGATGGGWVIKCRRGIGIAGAQVGLSQTYTMPATTTVSIPFWFTDLAPTTGVYTITVTAAGSNGVGNDGAIEVCVSDPGGSE